MLPMVVARSGEGAKSAIYVCLVLQLVIMSDGRSPIHHLPLV